ncbi:MAG: hypothetical protein PHV74_12240 [Dehalococcoidia bacterium]|nr:hypothetical protein [Dehalococcoidia bacterium]
MAIVNTRLFMLPVVWHRSFVHMQLGAYIPVFPAAAADYGRPR